MTLVENDDIARLWSLVGELSAQIAENRERTQALQQQADELKGQAIHSTTGYALRRFNVDISKEKFESELERINAQLVYENNILSHENKQTALLLREYEQALETVMAKFRAFTHATQTHTLQMTSYYESLLAANAHAAAEASLHASTMFNGKLARLGELVRTALRASDGEVDELDDEEDEHGDGAQPAAGGQSSGQAGWSDAQSSSSGPSTRSKSTRQRPQAFGSSGTDPRWFGMGGGYTGKDGDPAAQQSERALERLTEEERLRYENEMLRALLGLQEAKMEAAAGPSGTTGAPVTSGMQPTSAKPVEIPHPPEYSNCNAVPPAGTPLLGIRVEEVADADDDDEDDDEDDEDDDDDEEEEDAARLLELMEHDEEDLDEVEDEDENVLDDQVRTLSEDNDSPDEHLPYVTDPPSSSSIQSVDTQAEEGSSHSEIEAVPDAEEADQPSDDREDTSSVSSSGSDATDSSASSATSSTSSASSVEFSGAHAASTDASEPVPSKSTEASPAAGQTDEPSIA